MSVGIHLKLSFRSAKLFIFSGKGASNCY